MKIAAIYSRKSKYTGIGESIENQIELCKIYGSKLNIEKFIVYEDEGFSGKNTNRPEFKKMIKDAHNKNFNFLICYRLDRVSRNISDFSNLITELDKLNINFISINEQFDTSTPIGRAMMYIASVFAQLERETIGERVRDNMIELSKSGRWLGGQTPMGFDSKQIISLDNTGKQRKMCILSPIEPELDVVKLIYDKYLELKSLNKVYKYLFIRDIQTKKKANWTKKKLQLILKNPLYVKADINVMEYLKNEGMITCGNPDNKHGVLIYNKSKGTKIYRNINEWIAAVSMHKGIINADDWLKTQKILSFNRSKAPRLGTSHTALLTGLLKCSKCGSSMFVKHGHISKKTGKKILYYVCSTKDNSNGIKCNNPNIRVDEMEKEIINNLVSIKLNKTKLLNILKEKIQKSSKCNSNDSNNNYRIIKEKETQIDNLLTQLSKEPSLSKYIIPKIHKLENELQILNMEKINNSDSLNVKSTNYSDKILLEALNNIQDMFKICSNEEKKKILHSILDRIYWDGNQGTVKIKFKK